MRNVSCDRANFHRVPKKIIPHCAEVDVLAAFRYVDVMLQLLERSGDSVGDDVWHRLVQLVTNNDAMQSYAARNVAEALQRGSLHEVCCSGPFRPCTLREAPLLWHRDLPCPLVPHRCLVIVNFGGIGISTNVIVVVIQGGKGE
jgi:hypothetical protein